jgi:hypothetical protein
LRAGGFVTLEVAAERIVINLEGLGAQEVDQHNK